MDQFFDQNYLFCILMIFVVSSDIKYILYADHTNMLCSNSNIKNYIIL